MPVELRDLLNNQRWVPVRLDDFEFQVAYRPSNTSLAKHIALDKRMAELRTNQELDEAERATALGGLLCEIICAWDLTLDSEPLAITPDTVTQILPEGLFMAIMEAVGNDGKTRQEEKKASNAISNSGLQPTDRQAVARNGTGQFEQPGTWA